MSDKVVLKQINIVTLNPEYFDSFLKQKLVSKAVSAAKIIIKFYNFRDYTENKHRRVDDYIYGGGSGMLIKCEPIFQVLQAISEPHYKILLSPQGEQWNYNLIQKVIKNYYSITVICGRYEGFDARVDYFCDKKVAIGEFVVSNGELGAMMLIDSLLRQIPGLLKPGSLIDESFSTHLWREYPQYTRPQKFQNLSVPDVLTSGDHQKIAKWKNEHSLHKKSNKNKEKK